MYYTHFVFFKNTPFTNFAKYINFRNNAERDAFFDSGIYKSISYKSDSFNMVRDRLTVRVSMDFDSYMGINYCYFYDERSGVRYYCQVNKTEYTNEKVTVFYLGIDVLTTFFQGDFSPRVGYVNITRQHVTKYTYNKHKFRLACSDYVQTGSPQIINQKYKHIAETNKSGKPDKNNRVYFSSEIDSMTVLFQCSADLSSNFGDIDEPVLKTSKGTVYDGVTSPVNLYAIKAVKANDLFEELSDYPWIEQNIKNIIMIPTEFIDQDDLESVSGSSISAEGLMTFKKNKGNNISNLNLSDIEFTKTYLNVVLGKYTGINNLLDKEGHLFNPNYFNFFVSNWSGGSVQLEPHKIEGSHLRWGARGIIGYDNKISVYPIRYNSNGENMDYMESGGLTKTGDGSIIGIPVPRGEFLNSSLMFTSWDNFPVLIDNYKMSLASSAYDRKLSEDNKLTNQIGTALDPNANVNDRFMTAMNVVSMLNPTDLMSNWHSEWQYYRNLQAQQNQAKISQPTVTSQTMGNAFSLRNGIFGISVKLYAVPSEDIKFALRYHKATGYKWDRLDKLDSVRSMSHVNFVQFDGEWVMPDVPAEFITIAKSLFSQGVSLYHNPDRLANPFIQDVLKNERVI